MLRIIGSLALILTVTACASQQEKELLVKKKVYESRMELQTAEQPDWFMNPPVNTDMMYGTGTSSLSNQGAALQQAKMAAMVEIAQEISSVVDNMATSTFSGQESSIGSIEKQVFQTAAKAIASANLRGVKVVNRKSVSGDAGLQTYVLVQMSKEDAARTAVKQIQSLDKEIMETNKNLLNDLDEAVKKRL